MYSVTHGFTYTLNTSERSNVLLYNTFYAYIYSIILHILVSYSWTYIYIKFMEDPERIHYIVDNVYDYILDRYK